MDEKKKLRRAKRKEVLLLKNDPVTGALLQDTPSCHVLVWNGGVCNGVSQQVLTEVLHVHCVSMPPGKDYAFVTFDSIAQAKTTMEALNGIHLQGNADIAHLLPASLLAGPPLHLFMSYVSHTPPSAAPILDWPPGLTLLPDFITPAEEETLLALLDTAQTPHTHLKHRQVLHYGYKFDYSMNNVDQSSPLPDGFPEEITAIIDKIMECGCATDRPDQLTVNRYPPGAGKQGCSYQNHLPFDSDCL